MQVTETLSQGLKRAYRVVLPAGDLAARLNTQLSEMKDKVRINGFRPGKVPVAHLRKVYGKSVMADIVQNALNEVNQKIIDDNGFKLAGEPKIALPEDKDEIEKALEARGDLAYTVDIEVLPKFELGAFDDIALERPICPVADTEVDEAIAKMAERNRVYSPRDEGSAAINGDKVTIDFTGKLGEEAFEGGSGTDQELILGSGSFIPGFEAQLEGAKAGDNRKVVVTFPADYGAANLAGKEANFDVVVKSVAAPGDIKIDDELAKGFGLEGLDKLKEAVRGSLEGELGRASREKLKRQLLDALDKRYSFDLPEGLVSQEFDGIWRQVQSEQQRSGKTFADENTTEEAAREEYRRIAERRVRLGLLLAEVGATADVKVTDEEVTQALMERVRQFPGQEKAVWDYYRQNAEALATLRAPIYEEKVIDHILGLAKVAEKTVTRDELMKADEEA